MNALAEMDETGRRVSGPSFDLVELQNDEGVVYTAIVFAEKYRADNVLTRAVELARSFMEFPMVAGLVELSYYLPVEGGFVFPTGSTRTVAEMIKTYRETKQKVSKRAVLELCYLTGQILHDAGDTGPLQGVYSHGDLDPSRILIKPDGDVQIIGYGVPSPEIARWLADESQLPRADALRYAPPERLVGQPEDVTSDLYSLACIAIELVIGEPLLDGKPEELIKAIKHGEAPHRLAKVKSKLGPLADLFTFCLNFDPRTRYDDAMTFVQAVGELLEAVQGGETLAEAIKPVHERGRGRALRSVDSNTGMHAIPGRGRATGRSIRPQREQDEDGPASSGRWGKVKRGGKDEEAEEVETATEAEDAGGRRRRRRTRLDDEEQEAAKTEESDSRRRRRSRRDTGNEEADEAKAETADAESERPRRRRTRRSEAEDTEEPTTETAAEPEAEEEDGSSRRRRRTRRTSEDDDAAKAEEPVKAAEPAEDEAAAPPPRRRTRRGASAAEDEAPIEEATAAEPEDAAADAPAERPRRRTRRGADDEPAEEKAEAKAEEEPAARPRRRTRRGASNEDADEAAEEKQDEGGDDDSPAPRRRRRRSG